MTRKDYEEIKNSFSEYIKTWKTRDTKPIDEIISPCVFFSTSTSLTMPNGAQDSIFGVRDFINDFPQTEDIHCRIYNYVCRIKGNEARTYAEVPCTAFNCGDEEIAFLEFTAMVTCKWEKTNEVWMIVDMRQEIVAERGSLKEQFETAWHFERERVPSAHAGKSGTMFLTSSEKNEAGSRLPVLRGEGDSPWLNLADAEELLTEEEKVKEAIVKYYFGIEHNSFIHSYEVISDYYGAYAYKGAFEENKKDLINALKQDRQGRKYVLAPIKFTDIEIVENRAFVKAHQVRGLKQNSHEYGYTKENIMIEHVCSEVEFELVKEANEWKIAFSNSYKGLYEVGNYTDHWYGDEC